MQLWSNSVLDWQFCEAEDQFAMERLKNVSIEPGLKYLPPQELEAEQMVLGACLLEPKVLSTARVKPDDFYRARHRLIFEAMLRMRERGEDLDLVTLPPELRGLQVDKFGNPPRNNAEAVVALEFCGGAAYLAELVSLVPTAANFRSHERLVISAAMRRAVIRACKEAEQAAYDSGDADKVIAECIGRLNDIRRHDAGELVAQRDLIVRGFEAVERRSTMTASVSGLTTGFRDLDRRLDGLRPQYYVIAGRPSMGKTALAECIVNSTAQAGNKVGMISIEMGEEQLAMRALSRASGLPLSRLLCGGVRGNDWARLSDSLGNQLGLPITYAFTAFTDRAIERVADDMVQRLGVQLIVIDYLQLASREDHAGNREQEIAMLSRLVKRKVKEHRVPFLVLSQLSRKLEDRPDKRPQLADLRESGSIEQDADVIMFVYRDEVYHCKCPKDGECSCGRRGLAEILIRKGRMEGTGDVDLAWHSQTTSFKDLEVQQHK